MHEPLRTAVDYGPLAGLIGAWSGDKGMDVAPEPEGSEENPYFETLVFQGIGEVCNAERQHLAGVHYRQVVRRKSTREVFHDQSGYWLWDKATALIMHTFTIPRAVAVLAGGSCPPHWQTGQEFTLEVTARLGDADWGIVQSPFMRDHARTTAFHQRLTLNGRTLRYTQTTELEIYGRHFAHTDENCLRRDDPL